MISIRLRVLLLATLSLFAVTLAFYVEYLDIQEKMHLTERTLYSAEEVHALSDLIHLLQIERGVTAGYLISHDEVQHQLLSKQRELTDAQLIKSTTAEYLHGQEFFIGLPARLITIRQNVDSGTAYWDDLRESYRSMIQRLLDQIIIKVAAMDYSRDISYELHSLSFLAISRENMGLMRALLNRAYRQGRFSIKERTQLSHYYGAFTDNIRIYNLISKAHIKETDDKAWLNKSENEVFFSTLSQIDSILNSDNVVFSEPSTSWWHDATLVINTMKKVEDATFKQVNQHIAEHTAYYKDYLYWYGIIALIVLTVTLLLTIFTIHRILKVLSILIRSLKKIEKDEDFSLRIHTKSDDEFGQLSGSINSLLSYTDKLIQEKDFLAKTDLLTGIMNRRSFLAAADKEMQRSKRCGSSVSVIFCDIDHFKTVNDQYGHAVGDEVLKAFTQVIKENLRSNDCFGRWGGEEFMILATDADLSEAEKLAEKLRLIIMELSVPPVKLVTSSFGVAQYKDGEQFETLCERADQALYQAKCNDRNKVFLSD